MIEHAVEFCSAFGEHPRIVDLPVREFFLDFRVEFLVDLREVELELGDVTVVQGLMDDLIFVFIGWFDAQSEVRLSFMLVVGGIGDYRVVAEIGAWIFFYFFWVDGNELDAFIFVDSGLAFFGDLGDFHDLLDEVKLGVHRHVLSRNGNILLDHVGKVVVEGLADPRKLNPHPFFVVIKFCYLLPVVTLFEVLFQVLQNHRRLHFLQLRGHVSAQRLRNLRWQFLSVFLFLSRAV